MGCQPHGLPRVPSTRLSHLCFQAPSPLLRLSGAPLQGETMSWFHSHQVSPGMAPFASTLSRFTGQELCVP